MTYNNIEFTKEDGIGILKINRPKALNALNTETVTELNQCIGEIEHDAEVKVLIITGGGEKSFVAGADIVEMSTKNAVEGRFFGKIAQDRLHVLKTFPNLLLRPLTGTLSAAGANSHAPAISVMQLKRLNSASLR